MEITSRSSKATSRGQEATTTEQMNTSLSHIAAWGTKWQVKFITHKTQLCSIARTNAVLPVTFGGYPMSQQEKMGVLGDI